MKCKTWWHEEVAGCLEDQNFIVVEVKAWSDYKDDQYICDFWL